MTLHSQITCLYHKVSLLDYDEEGNVDHGTIIPMVDGGTEGKILKIDP